MFIDLTRLGGLRVIRVRAEAIAYLDEAGSGCNVKLIGGETLRVNENVAEVERLMDGAPLSEAASPPPAPQRGSAKRKVAA